ncbi:MAG: histidinol dehydrogenase, partial [Promethearchaeota archaeon]
MMIKIYTTEEARSTILKRESIDTNTGKNMTPEEIVRVIIKDIKERKDIALKDWTLKLDNVNIDQFEIFNVDFEANLGAINPELRKALEIASDRIYRFHMSQPLLSWMNYNL